MKREKKIWRWQTIKWNDCFDGETRLENYAWNCVAMYEEAGNGYQFGSPSIGMRRYDRL